MAEAHCGICEMLGFVTCDNCGQVVMDPVDDDGPDLCWDCRDTPDDRPA